MPDLATYRAGVGAAPDEMLAWPLHGTGLESLGRGGRPELIPTPQPGPRELLCRVDAAGLCFSDIKILTLGSKHPRISGRDLSRDPVIMGHEAALTVVAVGAELQQQYHLGDRFVVQADIIYRGQGVAFGYALPGALAQFTRIGAEILEGDEGRYIIPIEPDTGYAEAALSEPWACVERSYRTTHRTSFRQGGTALLGAAAGADTGAVVLGELASGPWPARLVLAGLSGVSQFGAQARSWQAEGELEEHDALTPALFEGRQFADIVLIGNVEPEVIEAASAALDKGGILCLVRSDPLPRPVRVDVGRIHYDDVHYLGTTSSDLSTGYRSRASDLKPGGKAWFLGAGGPMGQMHVQRASEDPDGPSLIVASDVDADRLGTIPERYGAAAQQNAIELVCLDPNALGPEAFNGRLTSLAREGFDDVVCLAPVPALIPGALARVGRDGVLNLFAGLARGTVVELDLTPVFQRGVRLIGTSGSAISDLEFTLRKTERGQLSPNRSVAAIGGMRAARDGLEAVQKGRFAGKVVIYPQIPDLALTRLEDLAAVLPDVAAHLAEGAVWTREAELALIEHYL